MSTTTEERTEQWRYRYECGYGNCRSSWDEHYGTPAEAMAAFKAHVAGAHTPAERIKLTQLYLPKPQVCGRCCWPDQCASLGIHSDSWRGLPVQHTEERGSPND